MTDEELLSKIKTLRIKLLNLIIESLSNETEEDYFLTISTNATIDALSDLIKSGTHDLIYMKQLVDESFIRLIDNITDDVLEDIRDTLDEIEKNKKENQQ